MIHPVIRRIQERNWHVEHWNARLVTTRSEDLCVRKNVVLPTHNGIDEGIMVSVLHDGGIGYAATSDLSESGIALAFEKATNWAKHTAGVLAFSSDCYSKANPIGAYSSKASSAYDIISCRERIEILKEASEILGWDQKIVDNEASFSFSDVKSHFVSSSGANTEQQYYYLVPSLAATAHENGLTQFRTLNGRGYARQGGLEILEHLGIKREAERIAQEALELLSADNCPQGTMDLILMPDQMMLQIHESIGHPLELDRILGDERNYAGTSFVSTEMFGSYQYGSSLLNVTFDPTVEGEFASYKFDDEANTAQREFIIQNGILKRPLGSILSQRRANMSGVANARSSNWNRPPIDRMANLNIEPGETSLAKMIESVEYGVVMHSNISWSIDDSRNKFQFGCEYGQLIEKGKVTKTVRNPNYRGISATFWRNLELVGDRSTFEMYGTPYCGKGEPNQAIRVGHASPACLFKNVEVFGAEAES